MSRLPSLHLGYWEKEGEVRRGGRGRGEERRQGREDEERRRGEGRMRRGGKGG